MFKNMIPFFNATDNLALYLASDVKDSKERERLINRLASLDPNAVRYIACLLEFSGKTESAVELASVKAKMTHITSSLDRLISLVENADDSLAPFTEEEIGMELKSLEILGNESILRRCLYTGYCIFDGTAPGLALRLVEQLELLANNNLLFLGLPEEDVLFYRKLYVITVLIYSHIMSADRLQVLLGTSLCILSLAMNLELTTALGNHIRADKLVIKRENSSLDLATALSLNEAEIGNNKMKKPMIVKEWIDKIRQYVNRDANLDDVSKWLENDEDVMSNNEYLRSFIYRCVWMYVALVSGYFILENYGEKDFEKKIKEEEELKKTEVSVAKTDGRTFADFLKEHQKDFAWWIKQSETSSRLLAWLENFGDKKSAVEKLNAVLKENLPRIGDNLENVFAVIFLNKLIQQHGYNEGIDLVYFNEQTGQFQWAE